jgi:uncharacterized membrane protein
MNSASKRNPQRNASRTDWLIPAGLVLLSLIPMLAGGVRLAQLGTGVEITPDNARFFASPIPVVAHIISATVYSLLGAFQFVPGFRRVRPTWHRLAGRVLIPSGLVAALSGLWMTHFYPWPQFDEVALYVMRLVVGFAMTGFLLRGALAITQRKFTDHGDWMIRAYALGLGAGTQVLTHIPLLVFPSALNELTRALCMGAGWVINAAVAQWVIRKGRMRSRRRVVVSSRQEQVLS